MSFSRSAVGKSLSLPCGRCIGCRLERARQWAVRIVHEAKMHDESSFLTMTYAPEFLPVDGSISVEHCQKFLKRLRSRLAPKKIRFFLCGEYGEKLGRPHYHAIIFGEDFSFDRVALEQRGEYTQWSSAFLDEVWGMGSVHVGSVSFDSAAYVANYATKKVTNKEVYQDERGVRWPSAQEHYAGRTPEFLLMSRGGRSGEGGIGKTWFNTFEADVFPADEVISRGVSSRPPRYYFDALVKRAAQEFPPGVWSALVDALKVKREEASERLQSEVSCKGYGSVSVAESRNARRLEVRRKVAEAKLQIKRRNLESE